MNNADKESKTRPERIPADPEMVEKPSDCFWRRTDFDEALGKRRSASKTNKTK